MQTGDGVTDLATLPFSADYAFCCGDRSMRIELPQGDGVQRIRLLLRFKSAERSALERNAAFSQICAARPCP